jgi:hypothetical protein
MTRTGRTKGFFVSFDFTRDAHVEIRAFENKWGKKIILLTVRQILDEQGAR